MDADKCSPEDREPAPAPKATVEKNRRTRLDKDLPGELVPWLHRTARVHAHLMGIVRLERNPEKAGGQSLEGEAYAARVARGDRTILYECLTLARDELDAIRQEIGHVMDAATPTQHPPGSGGKVEVMRERMHRGESIFIDDDAR
jgi:hypothetical protein